MLNTLYKVKSRMKPACVKHLKLCRQLHSSTADYTWNILCMYVYCLIVVGLIFVVLVQKGLFVVKSFVVNFFVLSIICIRLYFDTKF